MPFTTSNGHGKTGCSTLTCFISTARSRQTTSGIIWSSTFPRTLTWLGSGLKRIYWNSKTSQLNVQPSWRGNLLRSSGSNSWRYSKDTRSYRTLFTTSKTTNGYSPTYQADASASICNLHQWYPSVNSSTTTQSMVTTTSKASPNLSKTLSKTKKQDQLQQMVHIKVKIILKLGSLIMIRLSSSLLLIFVMGRRTRQYSNLRKLYYLYFKRKLNGTILLYWWCLICLRGPILLIISTKWVGRHIQRPFNNSKTFTSQLSYIDRELFNSTKDGKEKTTNMYVKLTKKNKQKKYSNRITNNYNNSIHLHHNTTNFLKVKKILMIISYFWQVVIPTQPTIKFTSVMVVIRIGLCCWDMALQFKETNINMFGWVSILPTHSFTSLILLPNLKINIYLSEGSSS